MNMRRSHALKRWNRLTGSAFLQQTFDSELQLHVDIILLPNCRLIRYCSSPVHTVHIYALILRPAHSRFCFQFVVISCKLSLVLSLHSQIIFYLLWTCISTTCDEPIDKLGRCACVYLWLNISVLRHSRTACLLLPLLRLLLTVWSRCRHLNMAASDLLGVTVKWTCWAREPASTAASIHLPHPAFICRLGTSIPVHWLPVDKARSPSSPDSCVLMPYIRHS